MKRVRTTLIALAAGLAACISLDEDFPKVAGHGGGDSAQSGDNLSAGDPAPGDPAPGDPAPGDPAPGDPAPGDPAPGDPAPGDPAPGDPNPGDPLPAACGNGILEKGEACDDNNVDACGACDATCSGAAGTQATGTITVATAAIDGEFVVLYDTNDTSLGIEVELRLFATAVTDSADPQATINWTAATAGTAGNAVNVELRDPLTNGAALNVVAISPSIIVNLATDGSGGVMSTATEVVNAVNAVAYAYVVATLGGSGGGSVTGHAYESPVWLTGGADGDGFNTARTALVLDPGASAADIRDALVIAINADAFLLTATASAAADVHLTSDRIGPFGGSAMTGSAASFTFVQMTGGAGSGCAAGMGCLVHADCASGICAGAVCE